MIATERTFLSRAQAPLEDGYRFAEAALGHKVTELPPSLVPPNACEKRRCGEDLQGLSLKIYRVCIYDGKEIMPV